MVNPTHGFGQLWRRTYRVRLQGVQATAAEVMAYWKDVATAETSKPTTIYRSHFSSVKFTHDLGAYTLAFVPKGTAEIPAPSSSQEALNPSDVGSAGG